MTIQLTKADKQIIKSLHDDGRNLARNLAEEHDLNRQYVHQRLQRMQEHDIVENIGGGLYELIEDPRDTDNHDPHETQM